MKRSLFPALALALAMLACQNPIQGVSVARPSATPRPVAATATTASVATSPAEATAFAPGQDFTLVRIYPQDGSLQAQLAAEATKAQALGERPFLEFDATWCPPCQAITASLAAKNKLMLSAYAGIYLIHADVDQWGWDNSAAPGARLSPGTLPRYWRSSSIPERVFAPQMKGMKAMGWTSSWLSLLSLMSSVAKHA